jgi:hypothetical protein
MSIGLAPHKTTVSLRSWPSLNARKEAVVLCGAAFELVEEKTVEFDTENRLDLQ